MLTFDRKKLLDGYISRFGPLTDSLADAFRFLLSEIEKDNRFGNTELNRRQLPYCMATFKWETAHTMKPIDEFVERDILISGMARTQKLERCWVTQSPAMMHCFMDEVMCN